MTASAEATVTRRRKSVLVIAATDAKRRRISRVLTRVPFDVSAAGTAVEGLTSARAEAPDLVVVESGVAPALPVYLDAVRAAGGAPVILVGKDVAEGALCLESGVVVDYVRSPIWDRELQARAMRHGGVVSDAGVLDFGEVVIDLRARTVQARGAPVGLTSREFDLLVYLAAKPGSPSSREELLRHVWKSSPDWQQVKTVSEHVYRLRRKLEPEPSDPQWIITLPRSGYLFRAPSLPPPDPVLSTIAGRHG